MKPTARKKEKPETKKTMEPKNKETRYFDVELRAQKGEEGKRYFEGHAASFDKESSVLYEWMDGEWVEFVEVIARGAFDAALAADDLDLIFNTDHHNGNMLARLNPAENINTLRAEPDETGLHIQADVPNTTHGNDTYEHVNLGNLKRMSFAFSVDKAGEEWSKKDDGMLVRTITSFKKLYDVSIVRNPAYNRQNSTAINVAERSGNDFKPEEPEAKTKGTQYANYEYLKLKG